jgi:N-acetylmuramoyl-L-alanine amidase
MNMQNRQLTQLTRSLLLLVMAFTLMSFTVVIDAGHGGHDTGAIGLKMKVQEKNLNLSVAKQLATKIQTTYPEVKVVLTRDTDVFLPLQQRADIANKNHADLFISIHTNAAESRSARGAETFILGTERMEDNLDVAMRENAVMKLEEDQTVYQGFDPNSVESYILFELMQNEYMDNSLYFAELVQNQFVGTLQRANRGVRQAAFWVLLKSACPSVLVEMGFLSNAEEEAWLASTAGKQGIVNGIFHAFETYYKK